MTLPDLIARLESATGPSAELDWDIALAVGAVTQREAVDRTWFSTPEHGAFLGVPQGQPGEFGLHSHDGHRYTSSLDDALTLVPDGGRLREVGQWDDNGRPGGWFCSITRWRRTTDGWASIEYSFGIQDPMDFVPKVPPLAPNGAIAICISCLKARLAMEQQHAEA